MLTSVKYDIEKAPAVLPTVVACRCIVVFCITGCLMCVWCLIMCPVKFLAISSMAFFNFCFRGRVLIFSGILQFSILACCFQFVV